MGRDPRRGNPSGWSVLGLVLATLGLSVANPTVLVGVPLALMGILLPRRTSLSMLLSVGVLAITFGVRGSSGIWYLERAWAIVLSGWFVALSLRWPERAFLTRALGALAGAYAACGLVFSVRPGEWSVVDRAVLARMEEGMAAALEAVRGRGGTELVSSAFEARALETVALQGVIFPALLGLASISALALAWWLYSRLVRAPVPALRPLSEFRFDDHLVWVLILGFVALAASPGVGERIGSNAVVFMGALYALRGAAVVLFLSGGGLSLAASLGLAVAFVLVAPLLLVAAFLIGLGDTWFDWRSRRRNAAPG